MMPEQPIALFDMDGTLCDYDLGLESSLAPLRCPHESRRRVRDRESKWLKARMDLIRSSTDWWADLPRLDLGFDLWRMAGEVGYRRMILTQGPKKNPNAWAGKKHWLDRNVGADVEVTITRDKGLVYGRILVDDFPEYALRWLKWRPRSLVVMPLNDQNRKFKHPQVVHYDGKNYHRVQYLMQQQAQRGE